MLALLFVASAAATVYFQEEFGAGWEDRWIGSKAKSDYGVFAQTAGKFYGDAEIDLGVQTSQDAKFYAMSAKVAEPFSNADKDFVVQFSVKHEQKIDCGGGYLKIMPAGQEPESFDGESVYNIMFGPDICGSTKKVHVILNYKGTNTLINKNIPAQTDEGTHVYTLIIRPDQTYEVLIDQVSKESGNLVDDWSFLAPQKIQDPDVSKPEDWDDNPRIDDPEDVKPEGYDEIPEFIDDSDAEKPEDWDDDMDGDWEAPRINNPEFRGEWYPKQIDNPKYQGVWVHPEIDNPEYVYDANIYSFESFGAIGIDIWQVKAGSIFDNIIMTDSLDEAKAFYEATTGATIAGEKAAKQAFDDAEAERRAAEAEAAAAAEEAAADEEFAEDEPVKEEL